jgi:O-antigen ligase
MTTAAADKPFSVAFLIFFVLLNVSLAYLSKQSRLVSTLYAVFVLFLGLYYLMRDKRPDRLIYLCSYVVGAEIIWRSTRAGVFYEYGKYMIILLLAIGLLKYDLWPRAVKWPVLYFILLLPSIFLLPSFDREAVSFWLSGPLLLMVSTMFFSALSLSLVQVKKLLIVMIAPTLGIAFLATYSTFTATSLVFTTEANFTTSGGFGPVQTSLQLAFGSLLALYYVVIEKRERRMVLLMLVIAVGLMSQSIFTFSRSGLYNSGVTFLIFFLFYLGNRRQRVRLLFSAALVILLMVLVVFPYLNDFTNGVLALRYQGTNTSGRDILVQGDWQAFLENPWFGVGPGQSIRYHIAFGRVGSSHTEYTRLLAEHGSLGLLAMLILFGAVAKRFLARSPLAGKSFQILMTVWAILYMLDTTMRTASPGFTFGLGAALFIFDNSNLKGSNRP